MRTLLLLSAILMQLYGTNPCSAQNTFSEISVKLSSTQDQTKQSLVLDDPETGGLILVLSDYRNVYVYNLDTAGKVISERSGEKPNYNHEILLGAVTKEGIIAVYLANPGKTAFSCLLFKEKEAIGKKITFNNDEKYVQCFEHIGNFYLITLKKHSSILNLYKMDAEGNPNSHQINLSKFRFSNSSKYTLFKVLSDSLNMDNSINVSRINPGIPNTFDEVKDGAKLYVENGKAIITLDHSTINTITIVINLEDYTYKLNSFQQPYTSCEEGWGARSNSCFYKGHLYQVKFCKDEMHFQVYDTSKRVPSGKHLVNNANFEIFRNTYLSREALGKDEIGFNHIYFRRPSKQLDTTKTSIKNITKGLPAITVFESNNQNIVSIGGVAEYNRYYNYSTMEFSTINNFGSHGGLHLHSEWAKYFRTLLDKNFNHLEGKIIPTVFDEIRIFEQTNEKKEIAKKLFLWNGNCMYSYYDSELQKYMILKFKG